MDLNAFPDTVLRAVFDRVPLVDLIRHIPLVCHRWNALQSSVLSAKKSVALTILVRPNPLSSPNVLGESNISILHEDELTNEDGSKMFPSPMDDGRFAFTLTLNTFTSELVDSLIAKLRKVTYFKLCYRKVHPTLHPLASSGDTETIPLIIRLLDHWTRSLVTLKLHCTFTSVLEPNQQVIVTVAAQMGQLFETINTLPLLEHLTMDFPENLRLIKSLDMPILGRLKEFFFDIKSGPPDLILYSLDRYAEPNDQLRSIGLGKFQWMTKFSDMYGQSPLAKRFTMLPHMAVFGTHIKGDELERFVNTFSNLTYFSGVLKGLTLAQMTTTLAKLTNLIHLSLCASDLTDPFVPFSSYADEPADQIRPLDSVKVLTIWAITQTHTELAFPHWARMFPNLQIIHILQRTQYSCRICNFANDQSESEKMAVCVQRTLLPFKQLFQRTLKKVYYCRNRDYDNIQVFIPDTILDVQPSEDE